MPTETDINLQKDTVQSTIVDLEQTSEFKTWQTTKTEECLRYLKLSFNQDLPAEKLVFHPTHLGYPDPVGGLRSHARIWGYNYKIDGENVVNPATGELMQYTVWQKVDPPVVVENPNLPSDEDEGGAEFDTEPTDAA